MQREPVEEQPQPQARRGGLRDGSGHGGRQTLKRFGGRELCQPRGVLKRMRIWSKHSRPLTLAVVSEQQKRARIPETPASVNPETLAMMLESDGNLETYTELNAVALDLHEPDPETMRSSDLGWVPKSTLQEAREKDVKKLQQFETYEEVPQAEAEGQEIISSRFVDKWEESGELRSRFTLCCYTFGRGDENCACVGIGTRRGKGSGGHFWSFSSCGVGETFLCHVAS